MGQESSLVIILEMRAGKRAMSLKLLRRDETESFHFDFTNHPPFPVLATRVTHDLTAWAELESAPGLARFG